MIDKDMEAAANEFKALIEGYSRKTEANAFLGLCSYVASIGLQAYLQAAKQYARHTVKGDLEEYGVVMTKYHDHIEYTLSIAANLAVEGLKVSIDFVDSPIKPPTKGKPKLSLVKVETENKVEMPVDDGPKVS